jgi:hypothetical protein
MRAYPKAIELLNKADEFGPMHIVVGDGNMDTGSLDFVEKAMTVCGAPEHEWELLRLLRQMSEDDRFDLWEEWTN